MSFNLKKLFSNNSLNFIVGILSILIVIWVITYGIPSLFFNLFDTLLGNMILLGIILLSFMNNKGFGIGLTVIFIIIYQFSHMSRYLK
jgi:hypothetical protein